MYVNNDRADIELKYVLYRSGVTKNFVQKCRRQDSFVYYLSGGHEFKFSGHSFKVTAGEIVYLPIGSSYTNRVLSPETEYYQIDFKIYDGGVAVPLLDEPYVIPQKQSAKYAGLFAETHNYYIKGTPFCNFFCIGNLMKIIGMMLGKSEEGSKLHKINRIAPTLTYINEHYDLDTSVSELARISSTSVTNLEKIFRQCFGMSPSAYRNNIRIERAKLLLAGSLSIEDAARLTGFSDRFYFSKIFKSLTGISPGAYIKSLEI